jgi:hypothetical protein
MSNEMQPLEYADRRQRPALAREQLKKIAEAHRARVAAGKARPTMSLAKAKMLLAAISD